MLRITLFLVGLMLMNCILAQQIHGVIPSYDTLVGVDLNYLSTQKITSDYQQNHYDFPRQQYVIDPVIINLKNEKALYGNILARGVLELQSYNHDTGLFEFKLTLDKLVYPQAKRLTWNRDKTDIPIRGKVIFDIDNNSYTILKGNYNALTKEIMPLNSRNTIFFIKKNLGRVTQVGKINEDLPIPVTISIDN